jgi:hypothetical protein
LQYSFKWTYDETKNPPFDYNSIIGEWVPHSLMVAKSFFKAMWPF